MNARHRILHVLPDLARGGGQFVVLGLVAHADTSRFEVHVTRLRPPDDLRADLEAVGARYFPLRHGDEGTLAAALELSRHVRRRGIDLIQVHSGPDRKVGQLAAVLTGVPVVGHLHSPWAHLRPMHGERAGVLARRWSSLKANARTALERRAVRHYLAASDEVATFHRSHVRAPIGIARNGVDLDRFAPTTAQSRREARRALQLPTDARVLICVGRLATGKGQDELIATLPAISDAVLVIVGEGDRRESLVAQATELGVLDRMLFVGERTDVEALLPAADIFAFASLSEGLPLAVLEAMATSLPIVAYDLPGLRSVVTDRHDGRLVPLGDRAALAVAIEGLLDNERERIGMARAARATVAARFDARLMTRHAEAAYGAVLGIHPLHPRRTGDHHLVAH